MSRPRSGPAAAAAFAAAAGGLALAPEIAAAHGLVGRQDLPLPTRYFLIGAAAVLIASFVGLLVLWREQRFEEDRWKPTGGAPLAVLTGRVAQGLAGLFGVLMLVVVVWTGLKGTAAPDRNFSVTFVFVTFWLGMVVLSVLFGDVFRAFNPWRAIGRAVSAGFGAIAGQRAPAPLSYPERLGRWPAVAGIVGFAFFELVWGQNGFSASGVEPRDIAIATLIYSALTFTAMALFGVERWIERGEAFSVYFGMFSTLSIFERREGRVGRRALFSGSVEWAQVPGSVAMVLAAIGTTTFDGAAEGLLNQPINDLFQKLSDAGLSPLASLRIDNTLFLLLTLLVVYGIFWAGISGMRTVSSRFSARQLGRSFGHAFIPIALAYLVAHYFSLVIFQEQAQFTYLLSDPLGDGSDLFGTIGGGIDYTVVGSNGIWYVQFWALVIGHVAALVIGHDRALSIYGDSRLAARSQYWMLAMMVVFTVLGLFLLSQANG